MTKEEKEFWKALGAAVILFVPGVAICAWLEVRRILFGKGAWS